MSYTIPPLLHAILADADHVAPGRSHASDGTIGDLRHQSQGGASDHNPDSRGIVHAVDVTNDPAHGMDTWHWGQIIAERIKTGAERRVKYLVSNNGAHDVIFNPSISMTWRLNNAEGGHSHGNHLHTSILSGPAVENSTAPYFVSSDPAVPPKPTPTPKDDEIMRIIYGDKFADRWLTNWLTKRHIGASPGYDADAQAQAKALHDGGVTDGEAEIRWPQAWVDQIPVSH